MQVPENVVPQIHANVSLYYNKVDCNKEKLRNCIRYISDWSNRILMFHFVVWFGSFLIL